jgi:hypothetical protein
MTLQAEMMAILDATVAHLADRRSLGTLLVYKQIALYWYDQEARPRLSGLSWAPLPDGRRHCIVKGTPCYAVEDGAPLTLEELGV